MSDFFKHIYVQNYIVDLYKIDNKNYDVILPKEIFKDVKTRIDFIDKVFQESTNLIDVWKNGDRTNKLPFEIKVFIDILNNFKKDFKYLEYKNQKTLYLLYSETLKLYKIGISNNPYKRIEVLKREMNLPDIEIITLIPNSSKYEKILHNKFSYINVKIENKNGGEYTEWFKPSGDILNEYEKLKLLI